MTKTNSISLKQAEVYPVFESKDAKRVKGRVELGGNSTSSVADEVFDEYRDRVLSKKEKRQLSEWKFILNKSTAAIEMHFEKRVSQAFVLAVLCYNSGYRFREGHTVHQGFGAHSLDIGNEKILNNSAHPATLPILFALAEDTGKEIVFLYRSSFYDESNATIDLVKPVNDADRAIDEKRKDSLLREKTVDILNESAKGNLTPPEVAEQFIQELLKETRKSIHAEKDAKVIDVLNIYHAMAKRLKSYVSSPESIDRWLDLKFEDPKLLERDQSLESYIQGKIKELPLVIHADRHQDMNGSRIPCHFHDLFNYQVLSRFKDEELQIVEEAIGITFDDLENKISSFKYTKRTDALIQEHREKIDCFVKQTVRLISRGEGYEDTLEELSSSKKICLRPSLYRLRYSMIKEGQQTESTIKSKIENTLNKIKAVSKAHFLEDFFYRSLFDKVQVESMRLMFCKLLNISRLALDQKIREIKVNEKAHKAIKKCATQISQLSGKISKKVNFNAVNKDKLKLKIDYIFDQIISSSTVNSYVIKNLYYRRLFDHANTVKEEKLLAKLIGSKDKIDLKISSYTNETSAEQVIDGKAKKIQKVIDLALDEIENLNDKTKKFQRELLLELRLAHGMKQLQFVDVYKKENPNVPMYRQKVGNLENGSEIMTPNIIKQVSEIYGVSSSLFYPSHFAEV